MKRAAAVGVVFALLVASSTASAGSVAAATCIETKARATSMKVFRLLKATRRAITGRTPTDLLKLKADVSKAQSRFTKRFARAEQIGGCVTTGDAAQIEANVDAFVAEATALFKTVQGLRRCQDETYVYFCALSFLDCNHFHCSERCLSHGGPDGIGCLNCSTNPCVPACPSGS